MKLPRIIRKWTICALKKSLAHYSPQIEVSNDLVLVISSKFRMGAIGKTKRGLFVVLQSKKSRFCNIVLPIASNLSPP